MATDMIITSKEDGSRWKFDRDDYDTIIIRRLPPLSGMWFTSHEDMNDNFDECITVCISRCDGSYEYMKMFPDDILRKICALVKAYKEWGPWRLTSAS